MKKFFYLLTVLFFLFCSTSLYAEQISTKTIMVKRNQPIFSVQLPTMTGTGYSWLLTQYDNRFLTLIQHSIEKNQSQPGATQIENWQFRVSDNAFNAPHLLKIDLIYARPWNLNESTKQATFTIITQSQS